MLSAAALLLTVGGAPPAPPVTFLADEALLYPNCSLIIDPDAYRGTYADGAPIDSAPDSSGTGDHFEQPNSGSRPLFVEASSDMAGHAAIDFPGASEFLQQIVGKTGADVITASDYTFFFAVHIDAINTDNGTPAFNDCLVVDSGGWWGIAVRSSGSGRVFVDNFPQTLLGSTASAEPGVTLIICVRHEAGNLYVSRDGGTEVSIGSGNTGSISGSVHIGSGAGPKLDGRLGALVAYKGNLGGPSQRAAFITYLKARFGV